VIFFARSRSAWRRAAQRIQSALGCTKGNRLSVHVILDDKGIFLFAKISHTHGGRSMASEILEQLNK